MSPRRRWTFIALAAIGTGAATYFAPGSDRAAEIAAPVEAAHATPASHASALGELGKARALRRQRGDLFAPHSWAPPPAPPKPPEVPQEAAPQPPPNPYRFAGTVEYGGTRKVLLTRSGERVFEVKAGEVLEPGFRVQTVSAHEVTLLYEPLNAPLSVALVFQEALPPAAAGSSAPPTAPVVQPLRSPPGPAPREGAEHRVR